MNHKPAPVQVVIDPTQSAMAAAYEKALHEDDVWGQAEALGVSCESLTRLAMGWCETAQAFSFPMRNSANIIVGIRFRNARAEKWASKGSVNGIFVPRKLPMIGPLCVVEGPTDTAAALTLGLAAIGRPSNTAGREFVVDFFKRFLPRRPAIIIANSDPEGSDAQRMTVLGWQTLADELMKQAAAASVRVIAPPVKDVREWLKRGATKDGVLNDVEALV